MAHSYRASEQDDRQEGVLVCILTAWFANAARAASRMTPSGNLLNTASSDSDSDRSPSGMSTDQLVGRASTTVRFAGEIAGITALPGRRPRGRLVLRAAHGGGRL
jgi:hypothetical protein